MASPAQKTIYLAGKMRGAPLYNFPTFDAATSDLRGRGYTVLSPAEEDRRRGFDPAKDVPTEAFLEEAMRWDLEAIMRVDGLVLLPGWETSTGATAEMWLARWRHIPVMLYPTLEVYSAPHHPPMCSTVPNPALKQPEEDILLEALRLTGGERMASYGHPKDNFSKIAAMWSAYKGTDFTAEDVAMMMVLLKVCREAFKHKRDNLVDISGFARCGQLCHDKVD